MYGSLCLVSRLSTVDAAPDVLNSLVNWQTNAQFWLLNRLQLVQLNQLGTRDQVEEELERGDLLLGLRGDVGFLGGVLHAEEP